MNAFKTVIDLSAENRRKSQLDITPIEECIQDLECSKKPESLCQIALSSSIQELQQDKSILDKQSDNDLEQMVAEMEQQRGISFHSRLPLKLEKIPKLNCPDFDYEPSPEVGMSIFEDNPLKEVNMNQRKKSKKEKKVKGKENIQTVRKELKEQNQPNKGKRFSLTAVSARVIKDTFALTWRRNQRKSIAEFPQPEDEKPLTSRNYEASELDERFNEQIKQVIRENANPKFVTDVRERFCLPAQEENPLSDITLNLTSKNTENIPSQENQANQVKSEDSNTIESLSKLPIALEVTDGEKGETKLTVDQSSKADFGTHTTILTLTSFNKETLKKIASQIKPLNFKIPLKISIKYWIVASICCFIFACLFPLGTLFLVNDYGSETLKIFLNFGVLGLLLGLTEIALIRHGVDRPIIKRSQEFGGRNSGPINPNRYKLLNKPTVCVFLICATLLQIGLGAAIIRMNFNVNTGTILLSTIIGTFLSGILWYIVALVQAPKIENKKKILNKHIKQISQFRKDFLHDLRTTKKGLNQQTKTLPDINEESEQNEVQDGIDMVSSVAMPITQPHLKIETKKFRSESISKYSKELVKMRFNVLKIYGILIVGMIELLILTFILKGVNNCNNAATVVLGYFILIQIVGGLFAILESFVTAGKDLISTIKVINLIIEGGVYRYFYFVAPSKGALVGAFLLNFAFLFLKYYVPVIFQQRLAKLLRENSITKIFLKKKDVISTLYVTKEEEETNLLKPFKYLLQKFILQHNVNIYFGIGSLVLIAASLNWFPGLNFGLELKMANFGFYIGLVMFETIIQALLVINFARIANRKIKTNSKTLQINIIDEFEDGLIGRKMLVIVLNILVLFLLLLIFTNSF